MNKQEQREQCCKKIAEYAKNARIFSETKFVSKEERDTQFEILMKQKDELLKLCETVKK